jgi:hypothetical protein
MIEALNSSATSVLKRVTRRNIPEDAFFLSHRRENLKSYVNLKSCIEEFFTHIKLKRLFFRNLYSFIFTVALKSSVYPLSVALRFVTYNLKGIMSVVFTALCVIDSSQKTSKRFRKRTAIEEGVNYSVHVPQKQFPTGHF